MDKTGGENARSRVPEASPAHCGKLSEYQLQVRCKLIRVTSVDWGDLVSLVTEIHGRISVKQGKAAGTVHLNVNSAGHFDENDFETSHWWDVVYGIFISSVPFPLLQVIYVAHVWSCANMLMLWTIMLGKDWIPRGDGAGARGFVTLSVVECCPSLNLFGNSKIGHEDQSRLYLWGCNITKSRSALNDCDNFLIVWIYKTKPPKVGDLPMKQFRQQTHDLVGLRCISILSC